MPERDLVDRLAPHRDGGWHGTDLQEVKAGGVHRELDIEGKSERGLEPRGGVDQGAQLHVLEGRAEALVVEGLDPRRSAPGAGVEDNALPLVAGHVANVDLLARERFVLLDADLVRRDEAGDDSLAEAEPRVDQHLARPARGDVDGVEDSRRSGVDHSLDQDAPSDRLVSAAQRLPVTDGPRGPEAGPGEAEAIEDGRRPAHEEEGV